ncbi:response regulator transcription factor [Microbacterium sp. MMO-10]|uniref:response regulator transcription factor n=1 Tax=Microbacterium sp. MMO-10 TaxID=3081272 RepID=UPI00301596EF
MNVDTEFRDAPIVVVSGNGLMASGLSTILSAEFGRSVEQRGSIGDATAICRDRGDRSGDPPIIVFDLTRAGGPDEEILAALAAATSVARVIVIAPAEPFGRVRELFEVGVQGVVGSDADPRELVHAIVEAAGGNVIASRRVLRDLVDHVVHCPSRAVAADRADLDSLAPREREIVRQLMRGMTNREIAANLHLSEATVKAHLGRVMTRWQVRDRLQVVLRALGRIPERI